MINVHSDSHVYGDGKGRNGFHIMIAEIIILAMAFLFLTVSIFLFNGKGSWLISGYNTLSKEDKSQYDKRKVCRAVGALCIICCVILCIMAYLGYKVDSGSLDETYMSIFGIVFVIIILASIIIVSRYINGKAKKS